jgi:hypothetical protein
MSCGSPCTAPARDYSSLIVLSTTQPPIFGGPVVLASIIPEIHYQSVPVLARSRTSIIPPTNDQPITISYIEAVYGANRAYVLTIPAGSHMDGTIPGCSWLYVEPLTEVDDMVFTELNPPQIVPIDPGFGILFQPSAQYGFKFTGSPTLPAQYAILEWF